MYTLNFTNQNNEINLLKKILHKKDSAWIGVNGTCWGLIFFIAGYLDTIFNSHMLCMKLDGVCVDKEIHCKTQQYETNSQE